MGRHRRGTQGGRVGTPQGAFDGELRRDDPALAAASDDFGHLVHGRPEAVLRPRSDQDVATAVRWAAEQGRTFAAQGRRHSVFGRAQAPGGIVADMTTLGDVGDVQPDRVVVGAGATWRAVLDATLPHGLTPPVLPEYLDLSVGGTLVVGGIGATSARFGAQSDNVLDLRVVTGAGDQLDCSAEQHPDLFDAVRAGLGQVAVITRASLRLVAAPAHVRRFLLFYPDLPTMLRDQRVLIGDGRFEGVQGAALPAAGGGWTFRLDVVAAFSSNPPDDRALLAGLSDDRPRAQPTTMPFHAYLTRFTALEEVLRPTGQWAGPHPWLATFVGGSAVESVVGHELAELPAADLGPLGQVVISPIARASIASPMLALPPDPVCYAFNLIRLPPTGDAAGAARLILANRAIYDRVRAAGGTLYPVSAFPASTADWRAHFGAAFAALERAKHTYDPDNVLTPGYEVFDPRPPARATPRSGAPAARRRVPRPPRA